jgi:hypothetical protein
MNTIAKTQSQVQTASKTQTKTESAFWAQMEESRFGLIAIILTIVACVGGGAAAFGTEEYQVVPLIMVVVPTMLTLTFILAVGPMKAIMYAGATAIIMDILVWVF